MSEGKKPKKRRNGKGRREVQGGKAGRSIKEDHTHTCLPNS
jgi:hypothetical protein